VTIHSLTDELEEARAIAIAEKQSSAAVTATLGKAKLHGLLIDKKRLEGPEGGPVQIDLNGYSLEQLRVFKSVLAELAGASGGDVETGGSGDSEEDDAS
jgi:phage terminase small subunit